MKLTTTLSLCIVLAALMSGCEAPTPSAPISGATKPAASSAGEPLLRMQVDGKLWQANSDIFGAVNPLGAKDSMLISGSFGPNNASEQDFSMTLGGVSGPGKFAIKNAKPVGSVVQLANFSPAQYLIGGLVFEHDIQVEITQLQANPVLLAGTFSGWMQANDGNKVSITAGEFYYRE
jgi:hypothetical protein